MKNKLLIVLIVLSGIFLIYTSIVYACENGHRSQWHFPFDPADDNVWSMKIEISGSTESNMKIGLKNYTKEENNPKGYRQALAISMLDRYTMNGINTTCKIYIDDSKDPVIYTWYSEFRRIKRHTKTEFENKKYEKTGLTLKEIMDTAVILIDRDQVTVNDHTVTVVERNITSEAFNRF
jgi:hypothetical protein